MAFILSILFTVIGIYLFIDKDDLFSIIAAVILIIIGVFFMARYLSTKSDPEETVSYHKEDSITQEEIVDSFYLDLNDYGGFK